MGSENHHQQRHFLQKIFQKKIKFYKSQKLTCEEGQLVKKKQKSKKCSGPKKTRKTKI